MIATRPVEIPELTQTHVTGPTGEIQSTEFFHGPRFIYRLYPVSPGGPCMTETDSRNLDAWLKSLGAELVIIRDAAGNRYATRVVRNDGARVEMHVYGLIR